MRRGGFTSAGVSPDSGGAADEQKPSPLRLNAAPRASKGIFHLIDVQLELGKRFLFSDRAWYGK